MGWTKRDRGEHLHYTLDLGVLGRTVHIVTKPKGVQACQRTIPRKDHNKRALRAKWRTCTEKTYAFELTSGRFRKGPLQLDT